MTKAQGNFLIGLMGFILAYLTYPHWSCITWGILGMAGCIIGVIQGVKEP